MEDKEAAVLDPDAGLRQVEALLGAGLPIDLDAGACRAHAEECARLVELLGPAHPAAAARLRASRLVAETQLPGADVDAGARAAAELLTAARGLDDATRGYALVAWGFAHPAPERTDERVAAASEALELADRLAGADRASTGFVAGACLLLLAGLLEQGDIRSIDVELLDRRAAADDSDTATVAEWFHCLRSILDGDVATAERRSAALFAAARSAGRDGLALRTTQHCMLQWIQGRIDGVEDDFLAARREYPQQHLWPASLAWLWLLQGRRSASTAMLAALPDPHRLPRDRQWLATIVVLAEIARLTGPRERAVALRELLLPFADHLVPVGVGVAFWGTCARTLGLLEERLGLVDEAREHLELAVVVAERIGAMAWHAEAQIELAEFALRHALHGIPAHELLAEAAATSAARGFAGLALRARPRPVIRVLGGFEVVSVDGAPSEWSSNKARELLKMLVAARGAAVGREVLMDALWPGVAPERLGNRFAVAVNAVRRALDPARALPTQHHLVTEGESVRLHLPHLEIDLERFHGLAEHADGELRSAALRLYRGDAFSADPYADWAVSVRDHARAVRDRLAASG